MTKPAGPTPTPSSARARRAAGPGGYRKGEDARQRVLEAGLKTFAEHGYAQSSTRQIAELAGVTLPAIQYYFGGKQGLYTACAEAVAERFAALTDEAAGEALAALRGPADRDRLRDALKATMRSVAVAMTASAQWRLWGAFAARELLDPGPAFDIMMERLWSPGIDLVATMIARLQGRDAADQPARIRAMLLIASLTAFQSGRAVALRTLGWQTFGDEELAAVISVVHAQIDAL